MEQLNDLIFSFDALAERGGDNVVPFSLRISSPMYDEGRGFFCRVSCPLLREKPFLIFGVDEEQACQLSVSFIRQSLVDAGVVLVNESGDEVTIPEIGFSQKPASR